MAQPYLGEIRIFPYNFAPQGWAECNGQILVIAQYVALFSLLGTTYGGNGTTDFALPDLRGRLPIHIGTGGGLSNNYVLGETTGTETLTLAPNNLPGHTHPLNASTEPAVTDVPTGGVLASSTSFTTSTASVAMGASSVGLNNTTAATPIPTIQPVLGMMFCMALAGIFPSRN